MKNTLRLLLGAFVFIFADVSGAQKQDLKVTENSANISKADKLADEFELISRKIKEGGLSDAELNDLEKRLNILEREHVTVPLKEFSNASEREDFLSQMSSLIKQAKDLVDLQKSGKSKEEEFHKKVVKTDGTIDSTIDDTKEVSVPTTMSIEDLDEGEDFIPTAKKVEGAVDYSPQKVSRSKRKEYSAQELLQYLDLAIKMREGRGVKVNEEVMEIFRALSSNIDEFQKGNKVDELSEICARLNVLRKQNTPEKDIVKEEYKIATKIQRELSANINKKLNTGTPLAEMAQKSESITESARSFHREVSAAPRKGTRFKEKARQFGEKLREFGGNIKEKLSFRKK